MSKRQNNIDLNKLQRVILKWLSVRLDSESFERIKSTFNKLQKDAEDWEVFSSFSGVPRNTGKEVLSLTKSERQQAEDLRTGWKPSHWSIDQLGRTLLLLAIAERSKEEFFDKLEKLFISADMGESVALYQSLPVLPYPDELQERAAEGIRSNITSVFNAVALYNPYPADYLDDDAWNQVVLKALFVGSPLYLIQGIDRRSNKVLAQILVEYAHERWSAGREVSPELWRPVGPFIDESNIDEIKKVLSQSDEIQKKAAILALSDSESAVAKNILSDNDSLLQVINSEIITWDSLGKQIHNINE